MHLEEQIAVRVLKLGGFGYLSKESSGTELIKAIHQIFGGRKYITASLAEQMAMQLNNSYDKAPHELLSSREYQTLLLIAQGKTISQIAKQFSLGIPTISTYRARILEKMGMKTNADLVSYAIHNKLI